MMKLAEKNKKLRKQKISGIILTSLIVIIVILLILVTILIMQLNDNELLKNTNSQKNEISVIDNYSNQIYGYQINQFNRNESTNSWKFWKSESGHGSASTAMDLPKQYDELIIEISTYSFYILRLQLNDTTYKPFFEGFGYEGYRNLAEIHITTDKIYCETQDWNSDTSNSNKIIVYYR